MAKYRIPVESTFPWQRPVINKQDAAPASPTKADRYIVGTPSAGDAWESHENDIAWYDGTSWQFDTPSDGWMSYNKEDGKLYVFESNEWSVQAETTGDMTNAVYYTDNDGIVDKAESLDDGEGNSLTVVQAKEAYDRRGQWDAELGCILMEI